MRLILEIETNKDVKIKDFAHLNKTLEVLGLKLKKFTTIKNYKQRIIDGSSNSNSKCVYSTLCNY